MSLGGAPSAPAAPDPTAEGAAQTASNQATALFNFGLTNPNLNTPLGDISYNVDTSNAAQPSVTGNVSLSPAEQQILSTNQANVQQQGTTATTALNNVTNMQNTPYNLAANVSQTPTQQDLQGDLTNDENSIYQQQTQYLDPQFSQEQAQLQSQLANEGIPQGSAAYNTAMQNYGLQKQQAYSNAMDTAVGSGAAYQSQLSNTALANQAQQAQIYTQQYQEPLSLYSSLMSGTQPTLPQFSGASPSTAAPTNVIGAYQNAYQDQLNSYNAQVGASNSSLTGLFGLGTSLLGAAVPGAGGVSAFGNILASDRRLKKNIRNIGKLSSGIPLYEFEYIWDQIKRIGVMADEVIKIIPEAVIRHESGFDMVDYGRLA
jgi:hypothetical protein